MSSQSVSGARKSNTFSPGTKCARTLAPPLRDPLGDRIGLLASSARGGEVVVRVDRALRLVGAGQGVVDALSVAGVHARVLVRVDHQRGAVDAGQVGFGPGLGVPQAPHS